MSDAAIAAFLELIHVRVDAFAICEIGKEYRLRPEPLDEVLVHFVLKGEGFLECGRSAYQLTPGTVAVLPKKLRTSLRGVGPITQVCEGQTACPMEDGLVGFRAFSDEADLVLGCAILHATVASDQQLFGQLKEPIVEQSEPGLLLPLFEAMLRELEEPRLGTRAFVSALMKQILLVVLRAQASRRSILVEAHDEPSAGWSRRGHIKPTPGPTHRDQSRRKCRHEPGLFLSAFLRSLWHQPQ